MTMRPLSNPFTGCRLVAADGRTLPLRSVEVAADAGAGLAGVRLSQTFTNVFPERLRVTYTLPLPADGAVVDYAFTVDGARTAGRVARRADARAAFEAAVLEGRTAALLEQERSAVFTQEIGNVPPGATIVVEVAVEQVLRFTGGGWEWRWPTVVAPRYLGSATPAAAQYTVDVAEGLVVPCTTRLAVRDARTGAPSSPSHAVSGDGVLDIAGALDRDIVVRWPVVAPAVGAALQVARPVGSADAFGSLVLVPPAVAARPVPRDLILLLDTSGSMGGRPLRQLRAFASGLVHGLRVGDRLELIEFSSRAQRWRPDPIAMDAAAREEALDWIDALSAGGSTEMVDAIVAALAPLRREAQRQVVVVTDGQIGFEAQVLSQIRTTLPPGARLHTVAIGSAPNRTLTAGAARVGGGHEALVGPDESADAAVAELLARTGDPLWVDVRLGGSALLAHAPAVVPDLLAGAPARIALRLRPEGGELTVTARTAEGEHVERLVVEPCAEGAGRRVVATRFARERVEDLEFERASGGAVDAEVEAIGLTHQIATRLTSWVAIAEGVSVDPADPTRAVVVPQALPYAMSAEGVGLRPALRSRAVFFGGAVEGPFLDPMSPGPGSSPFPARGGAGPGSARGGSRRIRATIRARSEGKLVIEVALDARFAWDPASARVRGVDRAESAAIVLDGTTSAGRLQPGQTLRIVLAWTGPDPLCIEAGDLVIEIA